MDRWYCYSQNVSIRNHSSTSQAPRNFLRETALISAFGGPDVVTIGQTGLRELQPHQATVRVEVAGANPLDLKMIAGYMQQVFPVELPYVPGTDLSGVVAAVGAKVTNLTPGVSCFL